MITLLGYSKPRGNYPPDFQLLLLAQQLRRLRALVPLF